MRVNTANNTIKYLSNDHNHGTNLAKRAAAELKQIYMDNAAANPDIRPRMVLGNFDCSKSDLHFQERLERCDQLLRKDLHQRWYRNLSTFLKSTLSQVMEDSF